MKIEKIEYVTNKGTFTFKNYDALSEFEDNNWKMFNDTHYVVHHAEEMVDGFLSAAYQIEFKGINATPELSAYFDKESAEKMQWEYDVLTR